MWKNTTLFLCLSHSLPSRKVWIGRWLGPYFHFHRECFLFGTQTTYVNRPGVWEAALLFPPTTNNGNPLRIVWASVEVHMSPATWDQPPCSNIYPDGASPRGAAGCLLCKAVASRGGRKVAEAGLPSLGCPQSQPVRRKAALRVWFGLIRVYSVTVNSPSN